jgi:hypothetical protein
MRSLCFSLCVLASVTAFAKTPSGAKSPPPAAPSNPSALIVNSMTQGADVYVDGEKRGTLPMDPLVLIPGEHTIKVVRPGFAPFIDVFKIDKKKSTTLDVELVPISGVLKVTANVEAANVFIDGKFVGAAPITVDMGVGPKAIQVSKGGFKDFFQNVSAVAGQELSMEVSLEELPMGANPYKPAAPPPPKWYEKWWVWTAGAAGVVVVVTAIVVPVVLSQQDPVKDFGASYTFSVNNRP